MEIVYRVASAILLVSFVLGIYRVLRGPSILDRILALDFLSILCLAASALIAMQTGSSLALDVGLMIALTGFLSALFLCKYLRNVRAEKGKEV